MPPRSFSTAIEMRDGVQLAADVHLPSDGSAVPAVFYFTRYWRSYAIRGQAALRMSQHDPLIKRLQAADLAVVIVDVRGTGASQGEWACPWSADEQADFGDVAEWAAAQPWCDGRLAAMGTSYEGTTACLFAAAGHRAIRAVAPREFEYRVFDDIIAPGGIINTGFLRSWSDFCGRLDRNITPPEFGFLGRLFVKGVRPLDDDPTGDRLREVVERRKHTSIFDALSQADRQTALYGRGPTTIADFSLHSRRDALTAAGVPMQIWASWMDGTTARSALEMFHDVPAVQEVVIGSWTHTGDRDGGFHRQGKLADPPLPEQLDRSIAFIKRHFESYSDPQEDPPARVIRYAVIHRDGWAETTHWPPEHVRDETYFFTAEGTLTEDAPNEAQMVPARLDPAASTGKLNRWYTQMGKPIRYRRRAQAGRRMTTWVSAAAKTDRALIGESTLRIEIRSDAVNPCIFAYLELIDPAGHTFYVTEGMTRAQATDSSTSGRFTLEFRLLPTAVRIPVGWSIRVGLAATDHDTFPQVIEERERSYAVGGPEGCRISLPFETSPA